MNKGMEAEEGISDEDIPYEKIPWAQGVEFKPKFVENFFRFLSN